MKVAMVCPYDLGRPGGVQDQAIRLVEWLGAAGHDAWLVGPGEYEGAISVGEAFSVPANGADTPITLNPVARRRVLEAAAPADVVHIHEPFMPLVSVAALLSHTPPKVGTFHADPPRWVRRLYRGARPIVRRLASRLAVATAVSPVAASALGLGAIRVVPNGIDLASYTQGVARSRFRVGFLGRDEPRKGLDVLLKAWSSVRGAVPDAELVVGGADRKDVPGVTFLGRIGEPEKSRFLRSCSVFVAPNRGGESFGIVVAEAMAAGAAVVASAIPGFQFVLGDAGMLVTPGDVHELTAVITSLLHDPERVAALGAAAQERVEVFGRDAVLAGYVAAYREAAGGGTDRR